MVAFTNSTGFTNIVKMLAIPRGMMILTPGTFNAGQNLLDFDTSDLITSGSGMTDWPLKKA